LRRESPGGIHATDDHHAVDSSPGFRTGVGKTEWEASEIIALIDRVIGSSTNQDNIQVLQLFENFICCNVSS
jgi:hypothetical protein